MHLPAPSVPVRKNYYMASNIHLIDCSQKTVVYVEGIIFFYKDYPPGCHQDTNGIKLGIKLKNVCKAHCFAVNYFVVFFGTK